MKPKICINIQPVTSGQRACFVESAASSAPQGSLSTRGPRLCLDFRFATLTTRSHAYAQRNVETIVKEALGKAVAECHFPPSPPLRRDRNAGQALFWHVGCRDYGDSSAPARPDHVAATVILARTTVEWVGAARFTSPRAYEKGRCCLACP